MVRAIEGAATLLGLLVRGIWLLIQALPQVAAIVLIVYGVWLFDPRVAYIVAGVFLLVISAPKIKPKDRRET